MTLDARLEDLGNLDDGLAGHYSEKQDDGFHYLDVDGGDSGLKLEDVTALKSALEKQKEEISSHENVDKSVIADAVTAAVEEEKTKSADQLLKLTTDLASNRVHLNTAIIDSKISATLLDGGAMNTVTLAPHIKAAVTLTQNDDGSWEETVQDEKGHTRVDSEGNNLTMKSLVAEMRGSDTFATCFRGTGSSGAGKRGNNSGNERIAGTKQTAKMTDGVISVDLGVLSDGQVSIEE